MRVEKKGALTPFGYAQYIDKYKEAKKTEEGNTVEIELPVQMFQHKESCGKLINLLS